MLIFLFFMLGFLFAQYIIPLLDSLCSIVLTKIEVIKGKYAIQTTEINKQIREISGDNDEGFL